MPLNRRNRAYHWCFELHLLQLAHESAQNGTSACDHGTCEAELHALELTTQCHYSRQRKGFRAI